MRRILSLSLLGLLGLLAASPLAAAEFSPAQKGEMEQIIRDYLLQNPEVLRDAFIELQKREQTAKADAARSAVKDNAAEIYRAKGDFVLGNPDAKIALVEFFDYNCGYCKKSFPDMVKLSGEKDLKIIFKEFPILSAGSVVAAKAALAAKAQGKYWELHQAYMEFPGQKDEKTALAIAEKTGLDMERLKKDMAAPEVGETLAANMQLARKLGVDGTPGFVAGEELIPGAVGFDALSALIQDIRDKGGCQIC